MTTVTGQCDYIIRLFLTPFPQHGDMDRLARQSEGLDIDAEIDEPFNYCPCCGVFIAGIRRARQNS